MTCKCFARCEADCVCDHDWTPPAVIALRTELAMLQEANLALRDELTAADTAMDYERQRLRAELARAPRWRDVVDELPTEAQEVLFVRGGKTVHGAWIGGIFWHNNQMMAAAYWMPLPAAPVQEERK